MEICIDTVRSIFQAVLEGRMTREEADRWAFSVLAQEEAGTLSYEPKDDRQRIWDGVMYLYGIDTMQAPGKYLHTEDDIREAMVAKVGH